MGLRVHRRRFPIPGGIARETRERGGSARRRCVRPRRAANASGSSSKITMHDRCGRGWACGGTRRGQSLRGRGAQHRDRLTGDGSSVRRSASPRASRPVNRRSGAALTRSRMAAAALRCARQGYRCGNGESRNRDASSGSTARTVRARAAKARCSHQPIARRGGRPRFRAAHDDRGRNEQQQGDEAEGLGTQV